MEFAEAHCVPVIENLPIHGLVNIFGQPVRNRAYTSALDVEVRIVDINVIQGAPPVVRRRPMAAAWRRLLTCTAANTTILLCYGSGPHRPSGHSRQRVAPRA